MLYVLKECLYIPFLNLLVFNTHSKFKPGSTIYLWQHRLVKYVKAFIFNFIRQCFRMILNERCFVLKVMLNMIALRVIDYLIGFGIDVSGQLCGLWFGFI